MVTRRRRTPFCLGIALLVGAAAPLHAEELADAALIAEPPAAQPGECWTVVFIPPRYERQTESVLRTPAGQRQDHVAATYEWVNQTVTIPAGMRRVVVRPAEYEVTEEPVQITPAGSKAITVPARYRTVEERVASRTGAVLRPNPVTGELCVVDGPIEYQLVHRKVLVQEAQSHSVDQPARFRTVKHRKLIRPAETKLVPSAERQVTRRVKQEVKPAWDRMVPVPATYDSVTREVQVAPGRSEWRSVLCETNTTPELLERVQKALREAGQDPGSVNGRWGTQSALALRRYQEGAGLAPGSLTMETLAKLGVKTGA